MRAPRWEAWEKLTPQERDRAIVNMYYINARIPSIERLGYEIANCRPICAQGLAELAELLVHLKNVAAAGELDSLLVLWELDEMRDYTEYRDITGGELIRDITLGAFLRVVGGKQYVQRGGDMGVHSGAGEEESRVGKDETRA